MQVQARHPAHQRRQVPTPERVRPLQKEPNDEMASVTQLIRAPRSIDLGA